MSTIEKNGQLTQDFVTALDNRLEIKSFNIKKCKTMSSKKVPLWLTCYNSVKGAGDIRIMFKCGDDIRQDKMTL